MNEKKWEAYLQVAASEKMDSTGAADLINNAILHLPPDAGKVLCIGCGDGYELSRIRGAAGTNLNPEQVEQVRSKGFECYHADMHELPFEDKSFDTVFCRDAFEHALSPYIAISEFARVARKYVLIVVPDESWQFSKWHYICPTPIQMISLGIKLGLKPAAAWRYLFQYGYLFVPVKVDQKFLDEMKQFVVSTFGIVVASFPSVEDFA